MDYGSSHHGALHRIGCSVIMVRWHVDVEAFVSMPMSPGELARPTLLIVRRVSENSGILRIGVLLFPSRFRFANQCKKPIPDKRRCS
jgi:hypothetical protein